MIRKTFIVLFVLVALGCLGLGWASSRAREVRFHLYSAERHWAYLSAYEGTVWLVHDLRLNNSDSLAEREWTLATCKFASKVHGPIRVTFLRMPFWVLPMLFGLAVAIPLIWVWRRRIKRRRSGTCTQCAYDLTGLIEPRCPECGHKVTIVHGGFHERLVISRIFWPTFAALLLLPIVWTERMRIRTWFDRSPITPLPVAAPMIFSIPNVWSFGPLQVKEVAYERASIECLMAGYDHTFAANLISRIEVASTAQFVDALDQAWRERSAPDDEGPFGLNSIDCTLAVIEAVSQP